MKAKLFLVSALLFSVFFVASTALAMTEQERQTLIAQIQAQIAQLTQQLNEMLAEQQGTTTPTDWCHSFNIDLDTGDTGLETDSLQTALQKEGFIISASEIQNQQFGATTGQAVRDFKVKYRSQITTSGTTKVGQITRGMLNQLYGCAATTTPPTACTPIWQCEDWTTCASNQQIRTCTDTNYCGTTTDKPAEMQECNSVCTPNWSCGDWGTCYLYASGVITAWGVSDGTLGSQSRRCTDSNSCGITVGAPTQVRSCTNTTNNNNTCTPNWQCASWSTCLSSQQSRTCTDSNSCGTSTNKPATTQSCGTYTPPPSTGVSLDIKVNGGDGRAYISTGGSVNLTWTSSNASSCTAYGSWSGTKPTSGAETISNIPAGNLTYTLKCYNSIGSFNTDQAYVTATTCTPNWSCGWWLACSGNQQTRTCSDTNHCGVLTNKPVETKGYCDFQPGTESCVSKWECSGWSSCASFKQTRTCTDSNNCQLAGYRPIEKRFCYISENPADYLTSINNSYSSNFIFAKDTPQLPVSIKCGSWSPCLPTSVVNSDGTILAHQNRVCYDENYTYTAENPTEDREQNCTYNNYSFGGSGECVPQFSCTDWSPCSLFEQHRKCYDKNYCPNKNYAAINWPVEERFCMCPNVDIPAGFSQCLPAQLPAKAFDERASISSLQYKNSSTLLTSIFLPVNREECGCSWSCPAYNTDCRKIAGSCAPDSLKCDPDKVPETLTRTRFYDGCFASEIDYVAWSSRISKGESIEQAQKHTAEDQKRISAIQNELKCRGVNMETYYIGGESGSTSWMCKGEKYKYKEASTYERAGWQKLVNGEWIWASSLDWHPSPTGLCQ